MVQFLAQEEGDLAWLGMPAQRLFAKDQGVIHPDFKAPTAGWEQRKAAHQVYKFFEQFVRQTGGAWCVVSLDAKFDAECNFVHILSLRCARWNSVSEAGVLSRLTHTETIVDRMILYSI